MEEFFSKYQHLRDLQYLFKNRGFIKQKDFYSLDNATIIYLLSDHQSRLVDFISTYNFEKGSTSQQMTIDIGKEWIAEMINTDTIIKSGTEKKVQTEVVKPSQSQVISQNTSKSNESLHASQVIPESSQATANSFPYKDNELFRFLNSPDNLMGRIILGRYAQEKQLDVMRLKEMLILNLLNKTSCKYKLKAHEFMKLRDQIIEVFPSEDPDFFYMLPHKNPNGEFIAARGCLYNSYKFFRNQLRLAGLIDKNQKDDDDGGDTSKKKISKHKPPQSCLFDANQDQNDQTNVMQAWHKSFNERSKMLTASQEKVGVDEYLNSYPCIVPPLGITLLENDFLMIAKSNLKKNLITEEAFNALPTLFRTVWPEISSAILQYFRKSKIKEVSTFMSANEHLVQNECNTGLLALLLLPLCITINRPFRDKKTKELTKISRTDIVNSFILHLKNADDNVHDAKDELEKRLRSLGQPVYPYMIFCGKVDNINNIYVVVHSQLYSYNDPILAAEACYKCITALRMHNSLCDYVWFLIEKLIFGTSNIKTYTSLSRIVVEINKIRRKT